MKPDTISYRRKASFILLSGGSGSRIGGDYPKQFLKLGGIPVILRSAETFCRWKDGGNFICVSNPDFVEDTEEILRPVCEEVQRRGDEFRILPGGADRHASFLIGMKAAMSLKNPDFVFFIHDAARPFLETAELDRLYSVFQEEKAECASLVSSVTETVVSGGGFGKSMSRSLDRSTLFSVKTPQAIRADAVHAAAEKTAGRTGFTDLLTWAESAGMYGYLCEASPHNIKLTNPSDIELMESILNKAGKKKDEVRTAAGHRNSEADTTG